MKYDVKKTNAQSLDQVDFENVNVMSLIDNCGGAARYLTNAKLLYNDVGIYFEFNCEDDRINASMMGYNEPIYEEETVEFFFSSGGVLSEYLELEWNGIGGVFCANVKNNMAGRTQLDFVSENIIVSKIEYFGSNWKVNGFLPRSLFKADFVGEWDFNAYRIKRKADNSMILMAFSPTMEENFHKPFKFGKLKFI